MNYDGRHLTLGSAADSVADHAKRLFVERLAAHSPLGDGERVALLALPAVAAAVPGRRDVPIAQPDGYVTIIAKGVAARFGQVRNGKRQILALHIAGDMADIGTVLLSRHAYRLEALTSLVILRVSLAAVQGLITIYPAIMQAMWRASLINEDIAQQWLLNSGRRDSRAHLAHFLCEMACRYGHQDNLDGYIRFELPLTQEHLADILGLTSAHINRTLRDLRANGILKVCRTSVEIIDARALRLIGEFDRAYLHSDGDRHQAAGGWTPGTRLVRAP